MSRGSGQLTFCASIKTLQGVQDKNIKMVEDTISSAIVQKHLGEDVSASLLVHRRPLHVLAWTLLFEDKTSRSERVTNKLYRIVTVANLFSWHHRRKKRQSNERALIVSLRDYGEPGELCTKWFRIEYAPE